MMNVEPILVLYNHKSYINKFSFGLYATRFKHVLSIVSTYRASRANNKDKNLARYLNLLK
jgi:hypothetical protein